MGARGRVRRRRRGRRHLAVPARPARQDHQVVDIAAYQKTDPDPSDHDDPPNPTESNPFGLAALKNGDALVTDAANNDLLRVTPKGHVTTVARFVSRTCPPTRCRPAR